MLDVANSYHSVHRSLIYAASLFSLKPRDLRNLQNSTAISAYKEALEQSGADATTTTFAFSIQECRAARDLTNFSSVDEGHLLSSTSNSGKWRMLLSPDFLFFRRVLLQHRQYVLNGLFGAVLL